MDNHDSDGGSLEDYDIEWAFDLTAASAPATEEEMSGSTPVSDTYTAAPAQNTGLAEDEDTEAARTIARDMNYILGVFSRPEGHRGVQDPVDQADGVEPQLVIPSANAPSALGGSLIPKSPAQPVVSPIAINPAAIETSAPHRAVGANLQATDDSTDATMAILNLHLNAEPSDHRSTASAAASMYSYTDRPPPPRSQAASLSRTYYEATSDTDPTHRAASAITLLAKEAPERHKVVIQARDMFFGNISNTPKGMWFKEKERYEMMAQQALTRAHSDHYEAQEKKPADKRVHLEGEYDEVDPFFVKILVDCVPALRNKYNGETNKITDQMLLEQLFILSPGRDGKPPSAALQNKRLQWLQNNFMSSGARDKDGNLIKDYLQSLVFPVIYRTCYQGSNSNPANTKRSFTLGIKKYHDDYEKPKVDVPFLSFIPSEPILFVNTLLKRRIDKLTGKECSKLDSKYQKHYHELSDDFVSASENLAFISEIDTILTDRARQFMRGTKDYPKATKLWKDDELDEDDSDQNINTTQDPDISTE